MKQFRWNGTKNAELRRSRAISFEEIVCSIAAGSLRDVPKHRNAVRYPRQFVPGAIAPFPPTLARVLRPPALPRPHCPRDPAERCSSFQPLLRSRKRLPLEALADLRLDPPSLHPGHRRPRVRRRLPFNPLCLETPVIDPDLVPMLQKLPVDPLRPEL